MEKLERKNAMAALKAQGKTYREIAKHFDISYQRVHQILRDYMPWVYASNRVTKEDDCISCHTKENLHIHHINKDRKDNRINNILTVCGHCHLKSFHTK